MNFLITLVLFTVSVLASLAIGMLAAAATASPPFGLAVSLLILTALAMIVGMME